MKTKTCVKTIFWIALAVLLGFSPQDARATETEADWGNPIVSLATDLRDQAARTLARAEKRVQTAEADRSAAQSAAAAAKASGHSEALAIAREAEQVSDDELRLARQLLQKASNFLAEREKALGSVRRALSMRARGILLPEKGIVQRFAANGNPITDFSQPIQPGERVTTGPGGQAHLFVSQGNGEVTLQDSSSMTVKQDDETGFMADLELGLARFYARVRKWGDKKFSVRTPVAALAVRGTEFAVKTQDQKTTVEVFKGRVAVTQTSGKGALILEPGESATITRDGISKTASPAGPQADTATGVNLHVPSR